MPGVQTNRSNIDLPSDVAKEIIQKMQEGSAVMRLAREIKLPGGGTTIPVIVGDVEASWGGETDRIAVSNPELAKKKMQAYKLSVIVPFSNEFKRDLSALYEELKRRIPNALAKKFDATVFGNVEAPGENFDTFKAVTAQDIGANAYDGLVAADADIAGHDGITNGYVIAPKGKSILLLSKDTTGRPLFINSVAEGSVPMILGAPTYQSKGAYLKGADKTPSTVGIAGDWTQALYGTVEGVKVDISTQATLKIDKDTEINLWQQDMFAVKAEIEVGFRADTLCFNRLTATEG
ncbi:phage major capsid protein [Pseudobutyrivibrio sp.]|uniref:phage major capsid protein n=1 Tax=Pseudobutyrivibrio sp. TaxID=2014367 RepID=UPI001B5DA2B0|nr:phage major capsid protein [Pseudobutyrivibrio sp.]MBP3263333.1 phage major capsid protein [Pseudobutyrivibrio sp.]